MPSKKKEKIPAKKKPAGHKKKESTPGNDAKDKVFYVKKSSIHGKGCFAARNIKKGEYIGEYRGPVAKRDGTYVLWVYEEDGSMFGVSGRNGLRYLNHKKDCNARFDGVHLYAKKNIITDEEITFHYGEEWKDIP